MAGENKLHLNWAVLDRYNMTHRNCMYILIAEFYQYLLYTQIYTYKLERYYKTKYGDTFFTFCLVRRGSIFGVCFEENLLALINQ